MAAPLKPWEKPGVNSRVASNIVNPLVASGRFVENSLPTRGALSSSAPPTPLRPSTMDSSGVPPPVPTRPSEQGTSALGSRLGGYGYGNTYSGYGGYGGGYGGYSPMYGSGMYGGGYGGGGFGMNRFGQDMAGSSFARVAEESSRPAFQSIESIVQAFGAVSMMLESTYSAVYNSFRAVLGVADHFSRLRTHFTQVFSAFAVIRTLRYLYRKLLHLLGLGSGVQTDEAWAEVNDAARHLSQPDGKKSNTSWPIMLFFAIAVGGPWLIWRLLSSGRAAAEEEKKGWSDGSEDHFVAEAKYDFTGEGEEELSFQTGQRIRVAPKELQPKVRGWLLASIDGIKTGLIPANYMKVLGKCRGRKEAQAVVPPTTLQPTPLSIELSNFEATFPSEQTPSSLDREFPASEILDSAFSDNNDFNSIQTTSSELPGSESTAAEILSNNENGISDIEQV